MERVPQLVVLLARLQRLRGTGPVQPEFYQWAADVRQYLAAFYGDPSLELADFTRLTMENTPPDDAYMHHDGPWGLFERIARAEHFLNGLKPPDPSSPG